MSDRFSIEAIFKAVDRVTVPVSKMQNSLGKFARKASREMDALDKSFSGFNSKLKTAAGYMTAAAAAAGYGLSKVIGIGADFEQAITDVGAVSLMTRDQIKPLEDLALKLGAETKFTAAEAANAMEIMGRAGYEMNDIISGTPAILAAAAAEGITIAESADHVANALKGMGLETTDAARVADVLAYASVKTNSSISSLGESLSNVAGTARTLGVPLEETVAAVALLQDVGLDASVAGSAFNTMLTKMAKPTKEIRAQMKKWGISFKTAKGDMLPLEGVLEQLAKASDKAGGNFDQVAFFADLVGVRGQKAAQNLADLFKKGKVKELTAELYKAQGKAEEMARLRMNTLKGDFEVLTSELDSIAIKITEMQSGPLRGVVQGFTEWVTQNEDLIAQNVASVLTTIFNILKFIVEYRVALATIVGLYVGLAAAVKISTLAMSAFNAVCMLNPVVLLGAAIVGIGVGLGYMISKLEIVDKVVGRILEKIPAIGAVADLAFNMFGQRENVLERSANDAAYKRLAEQRKAKKGARVVTPADRVSESTRTERNVVDINLPNAPAGTTVKQSNPIPGVNLPRGFAGAY